MPMGWRIGRVGSVDIHVDPSWSILALLIVFNRWSLFSDRALFPELGPTTAVALAALTAVLYFGSILAHELAHAGVCVVRHIPVHGITLWMFGGLTYHRETKSPTDEFLITGAGPLTNLFLGAGFLLVHSLGSETLGRPIALVVGDLAFVNLVVGVLNLLPGYPLDGGHILRAVVWRISGRRDTATRVAGRTGQLISLGLIGVGFWQAAAGSSVAGIWLAIIGVVMLRAASSALGQERQRASLSSATAGQIMSPPPPTVPAEMTVADARRRYLDGHEGEAFPVLEGGRVVGFVSPATARTARPESPVGEASTGTEGTVEAGPSERMDVLMERIGDRPTSTVLVMDHGWLVGVIEPADLSRFLRRGTPPPVRTPEQRIDPPPRPDAG